MSRNILIFAIISSSIFITTSNDAIVDRTWLNGSSNKLDNISIKSNKSNAKDK